MNNNNISIIVPVYNVEKYIGQCIQSILLQKNQDFELIVIIDGSKDNSEKIIRKMLKNRENTKIIIRENKGLLATRLEGVEKYATCEFVMFVDADDWLESNATEVLKRYIDNDIDIIKAGFYRNKLNNKTINNYKKEIVDTSTKKKYILEKFLNTYNYNNIFAELIRKELFFNIKIEKTITFGEDLITNLYLFDKAKKVCFVEEIVYNYRYNENSITNSVVESKLYKNLQDAFKSYDYLIKYAKKNGDSNNIKHAYVRKLQEINSILLKFIYLEDYSNKSIRLIYKKYFNENDIKEIRKKIHIVDLFKFKCSHILFACLLFLNMYILYYNIIILGKKLRKINDKKQKRIKKCT